MNGDIPFGVGPFLFDEPVPTGTVFRTQTDQLDLMRLVMLVIGFTIGWFARR